MIVKVKTDAELNRLLDALDKEIVNASDYHRLICNLAGAAQAHEREFQQSPTFWALTFAALGEARMLALCKVYDQHSKSLNLVNLLDTINANPAMFEEGPFRQRLKTNPSVDWLAHAIRVPSHTQLDEDTVYASNKNPLVKKLTTWRGSIIAHRSAKVVLGKDLELRENPWSREEIEELIEHAFEIFNRYSVAFRASSRTPMLIGEDDYKGLFHFLQLGLAKRDEDLEKELQLYKEAKAKLEDRK